MCCPRPVGRRDPDIGHAVLTGAVSDLATVGRPAPDFGVNSVKRRTVSVWVAADVTRRQPTLFTAGGIHGPEVWRLSGHAQKADLLAVGRPLGLEGFGGKADRLPLAPERFGEEQT